MVLIFDILTITSSIWIMVHSIKKIFHGKYSMLHFCVIIFFIMQVIPIGVGYFGTLDKIEKYYPYMYYAMIDENVAIVYDIFAIVSMVVMYKYANRYANKGKMANILKSDLGNKKTIIIFLCVIGMLMPILGVLMAPDPNIYKEFSYFYTHSYGQTDSIYIYHNSTMSILIYISFFSTILYYYIEKKHKNIITLLSTLCITWINGKRTLLVFLLFAILIIDFFRWDKKDKKYIKKLVKKAILFLIIIVVYYIIYANITKKSTFADNFLLYTTYFSRLCNVKLAIYDLLYDKKMLDYPCQTLLFNLTFYIPRSIWNNKPYPYYRYFTSYAYFGVSDKVIPNMQFQVNIWSEFISNLGIIGYVLALVLILWMVKTSERSENKIVFLTGNVFIMLYMMFGFEHIAQMLIIVWILSIVLSHFPIKIKF